MKIIEKASPFSGRISVPSSKSYTVRALLMAAIAEGTTEVTHPLDCDDSRYMLDCIRKIGYETGGSFAAGLSIGERKGMSANEVELYVGNAGTAMRFLAGFLCFTP